MQHCAQRYVLIVTNNRAKVLKKVGNTTNWLYDSIKVTSYSCSNKRKRTKKLNREHHLRRDIATKKRDGASLSHLHIVINICYR